MNFRQLGKNGPSVSAIGYGCMGLSRGAYGKIIAKNKAIDLIKNIYQTHGINFFDTADVYGMGHNEELLSEAVKDFRDKIIIATKCAL